MKISSNILISIVKVQSTIIIGVHIGTIVIVCVPSHYIVGIQASMHAQGFVYYSTCISFVLRHFLLQ